MLKNLLAVLIGLVVTVSSVGAVKLTVEERSGIARVSEPVN